MCFPLWSMTPPGLCTVFMFSPALQLLLIFQYLSFFPPQLLHDLVLFPKTKTKTKQMSRESMCSSFKLVSQDTDLVIYPPDWGSFNRREHMTLFCLCGPTVVFTKWIKYCNYCVLCCLLTCFLSRSSSSSQTHGSGRPEELHLLAESERWCHRVCRAGLRHVQSSAQTTVIRQHDTATSLPRSLCWLGSSSSTWKTLKDLTNQTTRLLASTSSLSSSNKIKNPRYILYAI